MVSHQMCASVSPTGSTDISSIFTARRILRRGCTKSLVICTPLGVDTKCRSSPFHCSLDHSGFVVSNDYRSSIMVYHPLSSERGLSGVGDPTVDPSPSCSYQHSGTSWTPFVRDRQDWDGWYSVRIPSWIFPCVLVVQCTFCRS